MLELRTNVVLDTEKIKTWMEAQAQLEALPMRQLFGILKKLPGCRRGATSAERAADIVRWLQTEKWATREGSHAEIRRRRRIYGLGCCCCGSFSGSGSRLKRGSWAARNLQNTGFQDQ